MFLKRPQFRPAEVVLFAFTVRRKGTSASLMHSSWEMNTQNAILAHLRIIQDSFGRKRE
jgi:hypothetical protein